MKTSKAITLVMMALALSATPALAQRGGGGSRSGGGGHSSSMSSSRSSSSGSSFSGSSRSSSYSGSSRSSSYSSPSRSSSYSSSNRSSSSSNASRSGSYSRPSRSSSSSAPSRSGAVSAPTRSMGESGVSRGASHAGVRGREAGTVSRGREAGTVSRGREAGTVSRERSTAVGREGSRGGGNISAPAGTVRASGRPAPAGREYARPGRPGGYMPPAARPIHPAPYFYHPWHHHVVHCHPIFWDPLPPRPWYWPGFWHYCNSYWYDYHVTDVVVVRQYVQDTYHVDMITYGISGDIMYAIVRDGGSTYLQVYDQNDHLLAEQKINRKYCNMVIDAENGGCWISKKHEKDPLLFIWADGQLLIYEAD